MADLINELLTFLKSNASTANLHVYVIIGIGIGLIVKFIILPIYTHAWVPMRDFFTKISNAVEHVGHLEKEFKTNGGSTLKDIVKRIEAQVQTINVYISKSDSKQEAIFLFLGMSSDKFGFYESDKNGECIYASPRFCEMTGLLQEEVLGMGWIGAVHNEDKDRVYNEWKTCVSQHRAFIMDYRIYHRREKKTTKVCCYAVPIRIDDDSVISYLGTIRECNE